MADKKITDLTELAVEADSDDVLVIVDTSVGTTKKIAVSNVTSRLVEVNSNRSFFFSLLDRS